MKLLFLCASLEPGRDGVGDYTRHVATECAARNKDAAIIALNDKHSDGSTDEKAGDVSILRLSQNLSWRERIRKATERVRDIGPDWISWQFVPYGFHPKGLAQPALLHFARAVSGPRCHIMFHELWNDLATGEPARLRLIGWMQRRGILKFLKQLAPNLVHTSNDAYAAALARENCRARVLPLFGNMPIAVAPAVACRTKALSFLPVNETQTAGSDDAFFTAVTFGTLHPQWNPQPTAVWISKTAAGLGRRPGLLISGRAGAYAEKVKTIFLNTDVVVVETGEQDANTISMILQGADIGIASSPWALIGKSGTASAMRDHGLPVLVPRDDWRLKTGSVPGRSQHSLFARMTDLNTSDATMRWLSSRGIPRLTLTDVANDFLSQLETAR